MRFDGFAGNERLKSRLSASERSGPLPQFILIAGPHGSGKKTLARILAAAMECTGEGERPCGVCHACRKVFAGIHPDVITVTDDNKYYSVATVRRACAEVYLRPNEGARKIYVFPQAFDPARQEAQNALLKITEEPPPYGAFLILTENAERMLATVRSRATVLTLAPLPVDELERELRRLSPDRSREDLAAAARASGGWLGQAAALLDSDEVGDEKTAQFAHAFAARDALALLELTCSMERFPRDRLQQTLQAWLALLCAALEAKSGASAPSDAARQIARTRTGPDILRAVEVLRKALNYTSLNVGSAHLCGALSVLLR